MARRATTWKAWQRVLRGVTRAAAVAVLRAAKTDMAGNGARQHKHKKGSGSEKEEGKRREGYTSTPSAKL